MVEGPGFHNRRTHITSKILSLFNSLAAGQSVYDKIAPKIEHWIEYVLRERFMTVHELVDDVSPLAWGGDASYANTIVRFLKEFFDAPHRSERARSFVDKLCEQILRWFAIASAENLSMNYIRYPKSVANYGGCSFTHAATFVGHLIQKDLLNRELLQRHLIKPLISHHYADDANPPVDGLVRGTAIYQLFVTAGNTLLRGLLEPEDVQACFEILNARGISGLDAEKLQVGCAARSVSYVGINLFDQELREIHTTWLGQGEVESQRNTAENEGSEEEEEDMAAEPPAETETPVAFAPQDLPAAETDIDIPFSIPQSIELPSIFHNVGSSSDTFVDIPAAFSSPTLSISTVSDLTPTELSEEVEYGEEQATTRHATFYFDDGNTEVVCGETLFRVHSTILSFSSPRLRDMLSPTTLLNAPMPGGCPRIVFKDTADDFAVLLKMIYTPGYANPPIGVDFED